VNEDLEVGALVLASKLLFVLEPLLREAKEDKNDPENDLEIICYFDGVIKAYETAIELIKGEQK